MGRLSDLSIVITGSSSGIGEAIAQRFWEEGARLTLGSRTEPESVGAGARWHETDVSDSAQADALIAHSCLLYTSPSPRDATLSRMPSSA